MDSRVNVRTQNWWWSNGPMTPKWPWLAQMFHSAIISTVTFDADTQFISRNGKRSLELLLEPAVGIAHMQTECLGAFNVDGAEYHLPRLTFRDARISDPIRLGIFAAIHG